MKKKKLTINTLALGNLKQRRKQYTIMIIGIILAMVFSSSIVLFMFSARETYAEELNKKYGKQDQALTSETMTDADYKDAVEKGFLLDYGFMHNIGYAYTDENAKQLGCAVTWMDDTADSLYYLTLLEGRKPTAENEIAIEKTALKKLGYKEAAIGDKIKVNLDIANGFNFGKTLKKEYTVVGIYDDRKTMVGERGYSDGGNIVFDQITPAIYVAQGTQVEVGGKELKLGVIKANAHHGKYVSERDGHAYYNDFAYHIYFQDKGYEYNSCFSGASGYSSFGTLDALFGGGNYMGIIIAVMVFASCVSIINAFNTNLKERKKQIGMLRAVGTTKRQIINIFGREAFIISLIATPISVAVSYVLVRTALTIIGNDCIMSNSIWALFISTVINVVVVMLAALIPLSIASRITPMQAIRNIDINRKAKNKKIKSNHSFKPASHLASRITKFYKGSTVAVSIMLTITICFSCVAFSFISYSINNISKYPHEYELMNVSRNDYDGKNFDDAIGLTETERLNISDLSYVKNTYGKKELSCAVEIDELTDFFMIFQYQLFEYRDNGLYYDDYPKSNDELRENLKNRNSQEYEDKKNELNIQKEMLGTRIYAYEESDLNKIEKSLTAGKINYEKLASGEEIILVCPQKAELVAHIKQNFKDVHGQFDKQVGKYALNCEHIIGGESPYKLGDEITLAIGTYSYDESKDISVIKTVEKKTVKIGAIVSPNELGFYKNGIAAPSFGILTTLEGMNKFKMNLPYSDLFFDVNEEIDDDLDSKIQEDMMVYTEKYSGWFESEYSYVKFQEREIQKLLVGIIALIIIGFAICISIINNSISAQIRENKRVIGTLRAVGADQKELSKSYIYQMLSMFGWGTGLGYGLFLAIFGIVKFICIKTGGNFEFVFNPWVTVVMTVLSFALCSVNVFSKVKKEMKNSIVENIREL